jgi:hypothetical protein
MKVTMNLKTMAATYKVVKDDDFCDESESFNRSDLNCTDDGGSRIEESMRTIMMDRT